MDRQEPTERVRLTLDRDHQFVATCPDLRVAANLERFERCPHLFEDFCIVTERARRGIEVQVAFTGEMSAIREAS